MTSREPPVTESEEWSPSAGEKTPLSINFHNELLAYIDGLTLEHGNTRSAQVELMISGGTIYEPWINKMVAEEKKRRLGG